MGHKRHYKKKLIQTHKPTSSPNVKSQRSHAAAQTTGVGLDERIVGTAEDRLGLAKRIDLAIPGLVAAFEVLDQPITLAMQARDVLSIGHQLFAQRRLVVLVPLQLLLGLGLGGLLVAERLRVVGALLLRIGHGLLVVGLGIFFLDLARRHLLVQVLDEQVQQSNHATTLLGFLRGASDGLWRWSGLLLIERRDARARDAAWGGRGRQSLTHVDGDALFFCEHSLRGSFIQFWIIEFLETVLRHGNKFFGGRVLRHHLLVGSVLLLAVFRCFRHLLVERYHTVLKRLDFLSQRG